MFFHLSSSVRNTILFAALVAGMIGMAGSANAQTVSRVMFEVRTGGDDLRGNDDNAFVVVSANGRVSRSQLNRRSEPLKDYTTTFRNVDVPRGTQLDEISSVGLFVRGFTGGFNGDNWNVDGFRVTAILDDGRRVVLMNEFASPLVRFTGDNRSFSRRLR